MRSEAALRPYRSGVLARTASNGGPDRQARAGAFVRFLSCAINTGITCSRPFPPFSGQFVTYSPRVLEIMLPKFLGLSDFRDLLSSDFHRTTSFSCFQEIHGFGPSDQTGQNTGQFRAVPVFLRYHEIEVQKWSNFVQLGRCSSRIST